MNPSPPTIAIDPTQLQARAAVYRLLGRLWQSEVDESLLRDLQHEPLHNAFVASGGSIPPAGTDETALEELAIDYCHLFLGPSGHLPPYQSVWAEGHFQGAATVAAKTQYEALGLPTPDGMADHLGKQLTAMAMILERLATHGSVATTDLDTAQAFFSQRLSWTDELCQCAAERARTAFYRSVATMTQRFLSEEATAWLLTR